MSTGTPNAEHEPRIYRPCVTGLKCPARYRTDYLRRVRLGLKNQGTGNVVEDLSAKLQALGSQSRVVGRDCTEACPIPGEKANVEGPDGKLYKVFWDDLDRLIATCE